MTKTLYLLRVNTLALIRTNSLGARFVIPQNSIVNEYRLVHRNSFNLRVGLYAVLKTSFKPYINNVILFNYIFDNTLFSLSCSVTYDNKNYYSTKTMERKSKIVKPWLHKDIELSHGSDYIELSTIQKFLHSLNQDNNYMLLIVIISDQGMKMAPNKIIENVNYFSDASSLQIRINSEISTIVERYHIEYIHNVVFRYREFILKVPISVPTIFKKNSIPISRKEKYNIFTDYFAPFSLESRKFGKLILEKGNIKYLYQDRFILEREVKTENNRECYYTNVKNINSEKIILTIKDTRINHSS